MRALLLATLLSVSLAAAQITTTTTKKHFCFTSSPLLSEKLGDCDNITAASCKGGAAAVRAYQRQMQDAGEPAFVLYVLEHLAPFVLMHPNRVDVNKQYFQRFNWPVYATAINVVASPDTYYSIRDPSLPMVTANVVIDPTNQWVDCRTQVYVDPDTGIGFTVLNNIEAASTKAADWRLAMLRALQQLERRSPQPKHVVVVDFLGYAYGAGNWSATLAELQRISPIKIDGYFSSDNANPDTPINQIVNGTHVVTAKTVIFTRGGETSTNLVCMDWTVQNTNTSGNMTYEIQAINRTAHDLHTLPAAVKDTQYWSDMNFSRDKDMEAVSNDPIVGYTTEMVEQTRPGFASCNGGECQIGSIFADSFRWKLGVDVGFANSGGPRGPGWPQGPVRFSDLFAAMPWQDRLCHATLRGLSLWEIYNNSINAPETISTTGSSSNGWQLFQVSGMRVYYNNNTSPQEGRLNGLEIWNKQTSRWEPLDRLKLYTVVITDFECGFLPWVNEPMNDARYDGEIAAAIRTDLTVQKVLAEYLTANSNINEPLDISPIGRFINQANGAAADSPFGANQRMILTETESGCPKNTFWDKTVATCLACDAGEVSDGAGAPCEKADGSSSLVVAIVVPIVVVIICALVAVVLVTVVFADKRDTANAPKEGQVTILFTDIQDSTKLWGTVPMSMNAALGVHHEVIRKSIAKYKAYEVKTVGDSFMIACKSTEIGLSIAIDIQRTLQETPVAPCIHQVYAAGDDEEKLEAIDDDPDATPVQDNVINGLRIRIGVHTGEPQCQYDEVTKGYDYYGPMVNVSARVEAAGAGGQICCTNDVLSAGGAQILAALNVTATSVGVFTLKGVQEPVELNQVMPNEFSPKRTEIVREIQDSRKKKSASDEVEADEESGMERRSSTGSQFSRSSIANTDDPTASSAVQMTTAFFEGLLRPCDRSTTNNIRKQLMSAWHIAEEHSVKLGDVSLCRRVTLSIAKKLQNIEREEKSKPTLLGVEQGSHAPSRHSRRGSRAPSNKPEGDVYMTIETPQGPPGDDDCQNQPNQPHNQ